MTEAQAIEIIYDEKATVSIEELREIIDTCGDSAAKRGDELELKTLGAFSYYEGQVNAFCIIKRLLDKLEV